MKRMSDRYRVLDEAESAVLLLDLPGWSIADGMLLREFPFQTYSSGVLFANAVAFVAERLDHHPDLMIGWGKVRVATVSHDAGGLTPADFELAAHVNALV